MRAIWFNQNSSKLIEVQFGESNFKLIDEFWYDWKPDGGEKTMAFCPNLVKDTPVNRMVVQELQQNHEEQKTANEFFENKMYSILNRFEK